MDSLGIGFFDNAILFLVRSVVILTLALAAIYSVWFAGCVIVGKLLRLTLREYNLHRESQELKNFLILTQEDEKRESVN